MSTLPPELPSETLRHHLAKPAMCRKGGSPHIVVKSFELESFCLTSHIPSHMDIESHKALISHGVIYHNPHIIFATGRGRRLHSVTSGLLPRSNRSGQNCLLGRQRMRQTWNSRKLLKPLWLQQTCWTQSGTKVQTLSDGRAELKIIAMVVTHQKTPTVPIPHTNVADREPDAKET